MRSFPLILAFFLSLTACFLHPMLFPFIRIWTFAPLLVLAFYRLSWYPVLYLSFFCGLLLDFASSQWSFGLFGCLHLLTAMLTYRQRKQFVEDHPLSFCLFTAWFSSVLSGLFLLLSPLTGETIPRSFASCLLVLLIHPFLDAFYASLIYALPCQLVILYKRRRIRKQHFSEEAS
ncbi:MAG: hypothetical protein FJZ58_03600 [Chlamydiae bacterium]|nr:hypothetical protein [Chlamydiota bacterium]